ncbi:MAG: hypothetical protein BGO33_04805 [Bacteroidia bacterium 43-41]|nr:MAG: hypothetical protein BGO33_04805 [Bacteroidia bacterium 43-41]
MITPILAFNLAGCSKTDEVNIGDDMQQIEGIALGLGAVGTPAATRATVGGVTYSVNTVEDPTRTKDDQNFITGRSKWKLDFTLYNGDVPTPYGPGSFTGVTDSDNDGNWKPGSDYFFPNYFKPWAEAWLYPDTKDKTVAKNQSNRDDLTAQDILYRPKSQLNPIAKKITVELSHRRAMINFKFEGLVREDISESTVLVRLGTDVYTPYNVRTTGTLEYMLILPENTPASSEIIVEYKTMGNPLQQPIEYKQKVKLIGTGTLGSNNCYCFTLSGKELKISPVTIVNWATGQPVSGEYVAVTAYPTFKGPANSTYYFYYDNQLTEDGTLTGTPKLQEIKFNNDGECTIKPDGRIITHIFKISNPTTETYWNSYKLTDPIILGDTEKMYIDLTTKSIQAFNP